MLKIHRSNLGFLFVLLALAFSPKAAFSNGVYVIPIKGVIDPIMANFVAESFHDASDRQASVIFLEMDTPGGMKDPSDIILDAIQQSTIPVVAKLMAHSRTMSTGVNIAMAANFVAIAPNALIGNPRTLEPQLLSDNIAQIRSFEKLKKKNNTWIDEGLRRRDL